VQSKRIVANDLASHTLSWPHLIYRLYEDWRSPPLPGIWTLSLIYFTHLTKTEPTLGTA